MVLLKFPSADTVVRIVKVLLGAQTVVRAVDATLTTMFLVGMGMPLTSTPILLIFYVPVALLGILAAIGPRRTGAWIAILLFETVWLGARFLDLVAFVFFFGWADAALGVAVVILIIADRLR